jgi:hypothetical protein
MAAPNVSPAPKRRPASNKIDIPPLHELTGSRNRALLARLDAGDGEARRECADGLIRLLPRRHSRLVGSREQDCSPPGFVTEDEVAGCLGQPRRAHGPTAARAHKGALRRGPTAIAAAAAAGLVLCTVQ